MGSYLVILEAPPLHALPMEGQHRVGQTDDAVDAEVEVELARLALARLQLALQVDHLHHVVVAHEDRVLL